ncbi:MAG: rcc01693 family protein [Hyphomicrobiaceae bacterium]
MTAESPARARFPWAEAMAFGLGVLKLAPREFWAMTPRELGAALAGALPQARRTTPLRRDVFDGLMQRFPDALGME